MGPLNRWIIFTVLAFSATLDASVAVGCGPFETRAVFVNGNGPDALPPFLAGDLGILLPTYSSRHLAIAYRYLTGNGLSEAERAALTTRPAKADSTGQTEEEPVDAWLKERSTVPGAAPVSRIDAYRQFPGLYFGFLNCSPDAFAAARRTLGERRTAYGKNSAEVREWLAAQDMVFSNCAGGKNIPAPAPDGAPHSVRADRAYQIAAAHFYAGDFDEAHRRFREIATDNESPWSGISPYLAARCMIRKGTLLPEDKKIDRQALTLAERELQAICEDQSLRPLHEDAERMLGFVKFRLHPSKRLRELAGTLVTKGQDRSIARDLGDFRLLFIQAAESATPEEIRDMTADDLVDWLFTFTSGRKKSAARALERWEKKQSLPWLIAALAQSSPGDKGVPGLMDAAEKLDPKAEGYLSVTYYRVRLLMETGKKDEALRLLDLLLAKTSAERYPSRTNLLLEQRLKLARGLDDFLSHAPRIPAKILQGEMETDAWERQPLFDRDAADSLNRGMALDTLKQAAESARIPEHLRKEVAVAAVMRGMLLDRVSAVRELLPVVKKLAPELTGDVSTFIAAKTLEERAFTTTYLMLRFPGALPYIVEGVREVKELNAIDSYTHKWWCGFGNVACDGKPGTEAGQCGEKNPEYWHPVAAGKYPPFAGKKDRQSARDEIGKIAGLGVPLSWLTKQAMARARSHPNDPRVPEALSLAVRDGRYHGCKDAATSKLSKQAFELLQGKYPENPWAKKTKYWY